MRTTMKYVIGTFGLPHLLIGSKNPRNWSMLKKFFVTFEICLLTTSVYIGSAIYTAGLLGVVSQFDVSEVAATVGLTLFVIGYALGPMIWVGLLEKVRS